MEAYAAFAAGLFGGVHCMGMCGGISAALSSASRGSPIARIAAFNAGRIGSYALAGAVAGAVGAAFLAAAPLRAFQTAMMVASAVMVALLGLYVAGWSAWLTRTEAIGGALWRGLSGLRQRCLPIDSHAKAAAAGALWGWVPCGLVYSMLVVALASGDATRGALVLAAFGLGTLPALLAAGVAAQRLLLWRRHSAVRRAAGVGILVLAVAMLHRAPGAWELVQYTWLCAVGA